MLRSAITILLALATSVRAFTAGSSIEITRDVTSDPTDYSWIKKFAAVGDSFTAGIGSGDLYSSTDNSYECSRYSYTYPVIINNFLGPSVEKFTYVACSGAISTGIFEQINDLESGHDLVILTAGGNDLCLSSIIDNCIAGLTPTDGECDDAISKAQSALSDGGFFKSNIKDLLTALDAKMNKNGIVAMALYAQYFNDQTDACTSENWQLVDIIPGTALPLTKERRTQFNELVVQTNAVLKEAIDEVASNAKNMRLVAADWDPWAPATNGQFCEEGASPDPADSSNTDVIFFKLNTGVYDLKRREMGGLYYGNSSLYLDDESNIFLKRDPVDPGCKAGSISLPDSMGKIFHPNNLGHEIVAAFVLDAIADARASILGQGPICPVIDSMTCYSSQGSTAYVSAEALNNNINDFCKYAAGGGDNVQVGWSRSKSYYSGSVDEYTMLVELGDAASTFSEIACQTAIGKIINGCDVPSSGSNPMNWKGGGKRVEDEFTYAVNIYRTNRPWPPPSKSTQSCEGWYKVLFQSYDIYGAGWATYDYGQQTLAKQVNPCCGSGSLTGWKFDYFDEPDENGYEWHAFFHTAIGTRRRCFDNNKVQCAAGGPCDSYCSGNG